MWSSTATTYHYSYDGVGRLWKVTDGTNNSVEAFTYDPNGNRTSELGATKAATYDAQDRMLTYNQAGGKDWTFTYRDDGTLSTATTSDGETTYDYDALGNLNKVTLPDNTIDYVVDGKGRRIAKKVNGSVTKQWIYDGQLRIAAELSGTTLNRFIYASRTSTPEMMIQYTSGSTTPTAVYRIFSDHLGSPRLVVNASNGSALFQANYSAFGMRTMVTGAEDAIPFGFAGGLYDPDTKLTRFGARDYGARFGRWVSKDPIRFGGSDGNLYRYVFLDPVNAKDISGLDTFMCTKPLHALGSFGQSVYGRAWYNPLYHQYVCVTDSNGNVVCGGQDRTGNAFGSPGKPSNDTWPTEGDQGSCQNVDSSKCVDNCMVRDISDPSRPMYGIGPQGTDCQEWADDTVAACKAECGSGQ